MMAAQGALTHDPPPSWACNSATGAAAASDSNLHLGRFGAHAIDGYMSDSGSFNEPAGHRRWLLHPPITTMGTGDVSAGPKANALFLLDDSQIFDPMPATREEFVAWPPSGFVPKPVVFDRWSFSRNGANFTNASVAMTYNGSPFAVTRRSPVTGYGMNTLVWDPQNTNFTPGTYHVSIRGVVVGGVTRNYTYDVEVFNPNRPILISSPVDGANIARGATVLADYTCNVANLASCTGTVPDGSPIDTAARGPHTFTVTATDDAGAAQTDTVSYSVVDGTRPTVTVTTPAAGAVYRQLQSVNASYSCSDEVGGSGLASCTAPVASGAFLDTGTLGVFDFTVTGTDNAGNQRAVARPYTVSTRPDGLIAADVGGPYIGNNVYAATAMPAQTLSASIARGESVTYFVQVGNDGGAAASFSLKGTAIDAAGYTIRFLEGRTDITAAVEAGTYTTPLQGAGTDSGIKVKITATSTAPRGTTAKVDIVVRSTNGPFAKDTIRAKATTP